MMIIVRRRLPLFYRRAALFRVINKSGCCSRSIENEAIIPTTSTNMNGDDFERQLPMGNFTDDAFLKIGNVQIPVLRTQTMHFVPAGFVSGQPAPEVIKTLKWMMSKELLDQDIFLIGLPGSVRLDTVLQYLELCNREFEYLMLNRDTTEADIKQRREISSGNALYSDLCAVRAAINGHVLVIDGVEKAERNVLPILNNLLENREMQLDDGRFLMAPERFDRLLKSYSLDELNKWGYQRVSERFRVIALGLPVPPLRGHTLDPPLRSRFQARVLAALSHDSALAFSRSLAPQLPTNRVDQLVGAAYVLNGQRAVLQCFSAEENDEKKNIPPAAPTLDLPLYPVDSLLKIIQIWSRSFDVKESVFSDRDIFQLAYPVDAMFRKDGPQRSKIDKFLAQIFPKTSRKISTNSNIRIQLISPLNAEKRFGIVKIVSDVGGIDTKCEAQKLMEFKVPFGGSIVDANDSTSFVSFPSIERLLVQLALSHSIADFCLLGPRGSGKSSLIREFLRRMGYCGREALETVILYQDMNTRELLQRRKILENGDTFWEDSQLVKAAKLGAACVLDGIDRVHSSFLETLSSLVHHRVLFLPDGTRLVGRMQFELIRQRCGNISNKELNKKGVHMIPESFRLIALGNSETAPRWLNEQLLSLFIFHALPAATIDERLTIISHHVPGVCTRASRQLLELVERLQSKNHSSDHHTESVASSLSLRRLIHLLRRHSQFPMEGLWASVERAALASLLPTPTRQRLEAEMRAVGLRPSSAAGAVPQTLPEFDEIGAHSANIQHDALKPKRIKTDEIVGNSDSMAHEIMVPKTLFFDNLQHRQTLENLRRDFILGSHLLLIGNQGVGKNKVTDRFLELLKRPRKYIQLHRDTTVATLTIVASIVGGRLTYRDSPLVEAVREGYVLMIDEADKAPLHVVSVLKALLDDAGPGEQLFQLSDGRQICTALSSKQMNSGTDQIIYKHPDFRMIMLANRPGFPFLGNDLYGLMGDLFAVHFLDNPSRQSELEMLKRYGPDVPNKTMELLVDAFGQLRKMAEQAQLQYPYSTRELVNVVRHLQRFPHQPVEVALRNVFDFDAFSQDTLESVRNVFVQYGVKIALSPGGGAFGFGAGDGGLEDADASGAYANWSRMLGFKDERAQGSERVELLDGNGVPFDLSRLTSPTFGKIDPSNAPHIGGNQWAGGVGGYNTAGLGGVGGPFRLDAGHPVHQMPDAAKAQVPAEILKKAREIAQAEYAKRLKEIAMSEHDADAYRDLLTRVERPISILSAIIDSLDARQHERQWVRNQTSGDLDDGKLIEGMTGERNVYRQRMELPPDPLDAIVKPKRIRLCFDVSGSMYRFNGYDQRLQRSLEAALLVMEALNGREEKIKFDIVGHSGENAEVPFVSLDKPPRNEKERVDVLKRMIAHSQFCLAGDNTVEALERSLKVLKAEPSEAYDERFLILLSDANLDRYGIRPAHLCKGLTDDGVNAFMILIGGLGQQATNLQRSLPAGKAFMAADGGAQRIPEIMQKILSSTVVHE